MTLKIKSIGLKGLEGYLVSVEVQSMFGPESIVIVGLPDKSLKEAKERITAAMYSLGYRLESQRVIINLSPSELKKSGPKFDLPIALAILLKVKGIEISNLEKTVFLGALSLDGSVKPVEGMLPAVLAARKLGMNTVYMPADSEMPLLDFDDLKIIYITKLDDVIKHLTGNEIGKPEILSSNNLEEDVAESLNFNKIVGHSYAKFALEVSAAGEHHLLMTGPPGCGKTMLAESFPSILPPMTKEASLEVISINQLSKSSYYASRFPPFRSPHHSASSISIIGGGQNPKPGEISLAHKGVLFLDEIAEFSKKTLDMLRQPLESGQVTISRVHSSVKYPASFILVAAMNPCPCGYKGASTHYCTCTAKQISAYQNRLSGPIRDRFDIFLSLSPVNLKEVISSDLETSEIVKDRIKMARETQFERYEKEICNGRVDYKTLLEKSLISFEQLSEMSKVFSDLNISNRAQVKILRLSRTIADLEQSTEISKRHFRKAIDLQRQIGDSPHSR